MLPLVGIYRVKERDIYIYIYVCVLEGHSIGITELNMLLCK